MRKLEKIPIPISFARRELSLDNIPIFRIVREEWQHFYNRNREEIVAALRKETDNMCAYCETRLTGSGNVDHIKSKSLNPELVFDWNNITLTCSQCNARKSNKELPINPYIDNPSDHIQFKEDGTVIPKSKKGLEVIEILSLNRLQLVEDRLFVIERFKEKYKKLSNVSELKSKVNSHYGCLLEVFSKNKSDFKIRWDHYWENTSLFDFDLDIHDIENIEKYKKKRIILEGIEISNFNGIENLSIEFNNVFDENAPCLFLIGENGCGKSSILKAISLALLGKNSFNKYQELIRKFNCIRRDENGIEIPGKIKLVLTDLQVQPIVQIGLKKSLISTSGRKMPVLAYGSTRLLSDKSKSEDSLKYNGLSIINLFNPKYELNNAHDWLLSLNTNEFESVVSNVLHEILLLTDEQTIKRTDNEIFIMPNKIPLRSWSDGYKTVVSLVCDILYNMKSIWSTEVRSINDYSGIILIDEIELHLHPKWKQEIVPKLRNIFPKIQFIITTHDPLCIQNAKDGELRLVYKDKDKKIRIKPIEVPRGLLIDNFLTGEWFSMATTLDLSTQELITDYQSRFVKGENVDTIKGDLTGRLGIYADNSFWGIYNSILRKGILKEGLILNNDERKIIEQNILKLLNK